MKGCMMLMDIEQTSSDKCWEILSKEPCSGKKRKKRLEHVQRVWLIVCWILSELQLRVDIDAVVDFQLLHKAVIFHDIAKFRFGGRKHHEKAEKILKGIFSWTEALYQCVDVIKAHKGEFAPAPAVAAEAAILRMADKIDKISQGKMEKFMDKYFDNMNKIELFFEERDSTIFDVFRERCAVAAGRCFSEMLLSS